MTTTVLTITDMVYAANATEFGGVSETTLDDALDATYVALAATSSAVAAVNFSLDDTITIGTSVLKSWFVSYRVLGQAGVATLKVYLAPSGAAWLLQGSRVPSTAFTTYATSPQVPPALTQAELNALVLYFYLDAGPGSNNAFISEASVSVTVAAIPVANVTYPTGSPLLTTTSSLAATWTHTPGSDGGPQAAFEVKVFSSAQYGAGGFSPDTSTPTFTSGPVSSSATSLTVTALPNSTTYRVYVRTAQSVNSALHWSAWDFEAFSTNFTPAVVASVTPVATSGSGLFTVTVARSSGTWTSIEVERTDDAGVTWVPVRGATNVATTIPWFCTTWGASSIVIVDYEAPNGVNVTYRARAKTALGVVGAWVSTAAPLAWTGAAGVSWLKDPGNPGLNVQLIVREQPQPTMPVTQGKFPVIGAKYPVVVSDVRRGRFGTFVGQTQSVVAAQAFEAAIESQAKLLQLPPGHLWGSKYIALSDVQEMHIELETDLLYRHWQIGYEQIARPADETNY